MNLEKELLSANELILLRGLIERLSNELKLEDRTDSDIRLSINECLCRRMSVYVKENEVKNK